MRESKEPIANLDMSSFIRYRRLQMPRMGNAHAKKHRDAQRDIFERFFPSHPPKEANQSRDKDSASLNSDDSGQCDAGSGSENTDSLLDGMRSQNTHFSSEECSSSNEGNNSNLSSSENESDFLSRDLINRSRDDLDSICSEMRFNRTRDCLSSMPHRGPRPHSTPPPRTVGGGGDGDDDNCPGRKTDHSKGTKKVVGGRSRKIGIQSKLTSGHKHRYKDKTNQSIHNETHTKTNSILLDVLDEDSQSNSGSDSALDTGSGSDAETVSRISISSDDGELASIEKLKNNNNSEPNTAMQPRNVESPVNGYRKVLFVCNL